MRARQSHRLLLLLLLHLRSLFLPYQPLLFQLTEDLRKIALCFRTLLSAPLLLAYKLRFHNSNLVLPALLYAPLLRLLHHRCFEHLPQPLDAPVLLH